MVTVGLLLSKEHTMAVKRMVCAVLGHKWSKQRYATTQRS